MEEVLQSPGVNNLSTFLKDLERFIPRFWSLFGNRFCAIDRYALLG
jgi:hypothetical protein